MLPVGVDRFGQCAKCKRYFNGNTAFDKHQRLRKDGSVICRKPETIGMFLNERGYWSLPYTEPAHWKRARVTAGIAENEVETSDVAPEPTNAVDVSFGAVQEVLF